MKKKYALVTKVHFRLIKVMYKLLRQDADFSIKNVLIFFLHALLTKLLLRLIRVIIKLLRQDDKNFECSTFL